MKVLLTGGSGVMGRSTIPALLDAGHTVVALARSSKAAKAVAQRGAEPVVADLFDQQALATAMRGCDAVVNYATRVPVGFTMLLPGAWRSNDRLRSHGTAVVAAAAREAGVGRLVQQSLSFVYADHGDDWVDEHSDIELTRATEHIVVAEGEIDEFTRSGGEGVSLRYGQIAGLDGNSAWLLRRARAGRRIGIGDPDSWAHVVHIEDVGPATVAALTVPAGAYNVGAEPVKRRDMADTFALAAGRKEGRFFSMVTVRLGGQRLEMISRSQRVSSQRFCDRTGWHPQYPKLTPDWFDGVL
ncbi:NAD-dependent epimerase/dehydratase family protein [Aeromicrobium sp.]|uniref:NAD-dependent epimerase/dehydratase family protein n=1 Tax=Aeromicrobium sp. TaxID=1871063 RepID=UPI003D6B3676